MLNSALSMVAIFAVGAAVWLLPKYLERRVAEAARGAVDLSVGKSLAEHQYEIDKQLEDHRTKLSRDLEDIRQTWSLDRERFARDYGLFATRRNEVNAETYALLEKSRGAYASRFASVQSVTDFSKAPEPDLRHLAKRLELVSEGERRELSDAIDRGSLERARELANILNEKEELRRANASFYAFRNAVVLNALYFSSEVDQLLGEAVAAMGMLSVFADEMIDGEDVSYKVTKPHYDKLAGIAAAVKSAMRREMQAGFSVAIASRSSSDADA